MNYYIYSITNKLNNKVYIGSTKSFKRRKYSHLNDLKNNKHHSIHLQNSYNKYGKDNFEFSILEELTGSNEERKFKEIHYINLYNSYERKNGYNYYKPNKNGFTCSDETRIKLKNTDYIKNISTAVDAYFLNGILINKYSSIKDATNELNINRGLIYDIINNKRKSYKGMTFVLKDKPFIYTSSSKQRNMSKFYK